MVDDKSGYIDLAFWDTAACPEPLSPARNMQSETLGRGAFSLWSHYLCCFFAIIDADDPDETLPAIDALWGCILFPRTYQVEAAQARLVGSSIYLTKTSVFKLVEEHLQR